MINIRDLSVSYGKEAVLEGFNLNLKQGGLYALIGPSGSGKSTLLKVLCGINQAYSGSIEYNGEALADKKLPVGYVPQNYGLLDWKTAGENIYLPLKIGKSHLGEDAVKSIIAVLQIEELLHKYPSELSGGQKQRVALARAFALGPKLLLMDEPFSALDAFTSAACQRLFLDIWTQHRVTSLFITHNISEAVLSAQTILLMDKKSKKITKIIENHAFGGADIDKLQLSSEIMRFFDGAAE